MPRVGPCRIHLTVDKLAQPHPLILSAHLAMLIRQSNRQRSSPSNASLTETIQGFRHRFIDIAPPSFL
jgi:hypothetical protein